MADLTPTGFRVLRAVAATGSLTAAGASLGYTQSAVSRQMAALEAAAGHALVERRRHGVLLTAAGRMLLRRAVRVLDEIDEAAAELADPSASSGPVRLGAFPAALAGVVPAALAGLPAGIEVSVREGTTPALVRAVRAGTLDLALIAQTPPFRPPDAESPPLRLTRLEERDLHVAVGPDHPLAARGAVEVAELEHQVWVASRSDAGDSLLGVWPGLRERADVRYVVRDWLAKLRLVEAGLALTTVPAALLTDVRVDVRVLAVRGEPRETRRLLLAQRPEDGRVTGAPDPAVGAVARALGRAVTA
ncbi:LysR family transcriptional regulator [Actinomycetospora sp. NBRC 106375]|uniref:LysR family transcriptional regulator n=1 Tax=Actinomycetospora sp. NBRC 106375 TaxID=3032207 RepID=UPI0024A4D319|nr:LysR family transcriptional regulator [Actinomycetospora sp. NBRC 106375]GLZ44830.1 LysR family transcriptional regulator [Actinomycetospora sp. NBRC 106375]